MAANELILCQSGDSLCSSDFTAENALCLPTNGNASGTARRDALK